MANIGDLQARVLGDVIEPGHDRYDEARKVWNGAIDNRPAAVVYPTGAADVRATVLFAREAAVPLSVRAGGHNAAGLSCPNDAIVIDLSRMRAVEVDPVARTARVAGGTLLSQLDHETCAFGLVTPSGTVGHTGVAGLTLGGGIGRLARLFGLSIDNLLSVELVTADGRFVRASEDENEDLFWGMRGAGANFGVTTSFTFALHPFDPPMTYNRLAVYAIEDAPDVLRAFREYTLEAPDGLIPIASAGVAEPGQPVPPELHGRKILRLGASFAGGTQEEGERATEVVKTAGTPLFDIFLPAPYTLVQGMTDEVFAWGKRYYDKGGYLDELSDGVIEAALAAFDRAPLPSGEVNFLGLGGAISRVPEDAMAYSGRSCPFFFGVNAIWGDPAVDAEQIGWGRATMAAAKPHMATANYVNAIVERDDDAVRAAYGDEKYKKLVELKTTWDPDNVFRFNANIKPA